MATMHTTRHRTKFRSASSEAYRMRRFVQLKTPGPIFLKVGRMSPSPTSSGSSSAFERQLTVVWYTDYPGVEALRGRSDKSQLRWDILLPGDPRLCSVTVSGMLLWVGTRRFSSSNQFWTT